MSPKLENLSESKKEFTAGMNRLKVISVAVKPLCEKTDSGAITVS